MAMAVAADSAGQHTRTPTCAQAANCILSSSLHSTVPQCAHSQSCILLHLHGTSSLSTSTARSRKVLLSRTRGLYATLDRRAGQHLHEANAYHDAAVVGRAADQQPIAPFWLPTPSLRA